MNEDVHDIDNLFKKNLREYSEEAPPSAWEAVNNALDKQQATLYKSKYYRLKRAALFLSLLCILGGMYFAFHVWQDKQSSSLHKQQSATSLTNKTDETIINKKKDNTNDIETTEENNNQQKKNEQKQKPATNEDSASINNNVFVLKQKAEWTRIGKNNVLKIDSSVLFANTDNNKTFAYTNKNLAKQKAEQLEESNHSSSHEPLQDSFLQPLPLQKEAEEISLSSLQKTLENRKPSLLSTGKASTVKIKGRTAHTFSLSLFAAPNFSFEKIEDDHDRDRAGGMRPDGHRGEQNNFSVSGGALATYQFNKNISLQSGVSVTAFSTFIAPKTVYAKPDNSGHVRYELNCSLGSAYLSPKNNAPLVAGDSSQTFAGTSRLVYINVPLIASYQINKGRFSLQPAVGTGLNVLVDGKIKTGLNDAVGGNAKTTTSITGLKRTYLNGSVGFGVEYKVSPKISLGLRPNAKFSLTPINKEMPVKSYQNYLSIEAGVRIKM